jgi:hypothetical protein
LHFVNNGFAHRVAFKSTRCHAQRTIEANDFAVQM